MLKCKNGHFISKNNRNDSLIITCPTCGEKLFETKSEDHSGTLLDSNLGQLSQSNDSLKKNEILEQTQPPTFSIDKPSQDQSNTQDLHGTLIDSQLLNTQSVSKKLPTQSESQEIKTVDLDKTENVSPSNLTLEIPPGVDTGIRKGLTNNTPANDKTDVIKEKSQATLEVIGGVDTRIQKKSEPDISTSPLSNPAMEKTGVYQNPKILGGSQTTPIQNVRFAKRKTIVKAPEGYEILGELGRGAMGVVYKAMQSGLKRLVALKMILSAGRASKIEITRFRIEAEAVAKLDHPNIVKIYDVGELDDLPFFSLEFVSGGTLASRVKDNIPSARQAAMLMRGIAEGMEFAHRKGIVHRDLKPANILLSPPDQAGEDVDFDSIPLDLFVPKITDFGLAKTLDGDSIQTREGAIMGTPSYMAPEQALGKTADIGPPADIYGLGAILYDIVTGIPPFRGETVMDTITQVIHREPVHPIRLNTKLPSDIGTICLKCLEKDPRKRYATAGALAEDLRRYLSGEPILARPTPIHEYAWKWAKRKPAVAALVMLVFFMVAGLSIGGYILAGHEKARADENLRLKEEAVSERNIAQEQKAQAERNFRDALAAVDQLLTKVGQNRLAHEPRMERVRRELLQQAKLFLSRFLDYRSEDVQVRWQTARSLMQLGSIEEMLGNFKEAEKNLQQSVVQLALLQEAKPASVDFLADMADCKQALGLLFFQQGKPMLAEPEYRKALELRFNLPENNEILSKQAACEFNLGQLLKSQGKLESALSSLAATVKKLETIVAIDKSNAIQKQNLVKGLLGLAQIFQDLGRFGECKENLEKAINLAQLIVAEYPDNPDYRVDLASAWNQKGKLFRDTDFAIAESSYTKAFKIQESLVSDFPATPFYRQELANSLNNLGVLLQSAGNSTEAENAFDRAMGIRDKLVRDVPWVPDIRKDLAAGLNNRGIQLQVQNRLKEAEPLYLKALEDLKSLTRDFPDSMEYNLELSRTLLNESVLLESLGKNKEAEKVSLQSLEYLQTLVSKNPGSLEVRQEFARARLTRAGLLEVAKNPRESIELFEGAANEFMKLALEFPEQTDYPFQQALALINLGNYLKDHNEGSKAEKPWEDARALLNRLVARYPGTPGFSLELSRNLNEWAIHLVSIKKTEEAEKEFEKARELQTGLVAKFPDVEEYRLELVKTLGNLGMWALSRNLSNRAEEYLIKAIELTQAAKKTSKSLLYALILPNSALANLMQSLGRAPDAEKYLKSVIAIRKSLLTSNPKGEKETEDLAQSIDQLVLFLAQRNRAPEGLSLLNESITISKQNINLPPDVLRNRLLFLAEIASLALKPREALEAIQSSQGVPNPKPADMIKAATLAARSIPLVKNQEKLSDAERMKLVSDLEKTAVSILQQAVIAGLSDIDFLTKNPDLEPIRMNPGFKELLKALELKKKNQ